MLENLKQIWPCQITNDNDRVSMLKEIRVSKCESLENLFPSNPLPLLSNLQELEVIKCDSIEVLFNIDSERVCVIEEESSSRLRKIQVRGLGKLRVLWRMKGLINNSEILISAFKGVERIEIISCKRFTNIFTPTTTNFDLGAVTTYISKHTGQDLEKNILIECSEQIMFEGERSELMDENIPNITNTCHNLQHLELSHDPTVKVVVEMDTPSGRELATYQDTQQLPLHHLKRLYLNNLEEMSHVWKCNWNVFSIPPQPLEFPFHNLTTISLGECHKIKYLFSPLMAKLLSNLEFVSISDCNDMEEVISGRDDEMCATSSHITNSTYFPHLDFFSLWGMPCLKHIDDQFQFQSGHEDVMGASIWSLCQYPKRIRVRSCDALSSVIPWYAVGQMKKLEELDIIDCRLITQVFESESSVKKMSCSNLTTMHEASAKGGTMLTNSPPLIKNINTAPQLSNLKRVLIYRCDLLGHVFTFSTLQCLNQLKELRIWNCKALTQVVTVKQHDDEINGNMASSSSKGVVVVKFPRLETLVLQDLPNLEGFFLGINIHFRWPLLNEVNISGCPQMSAFTSGESETPKLNYICSRFGKHSLEECGLNFHRSGMTNQHDYDQTTSFSSFDPTFSKGMSCSFQNLIEILVEYDDDFEMIIPSNALLQLQRLERVSLKRCQKVKGVFELSSLEGTNNESQTVVEIPNLKEVNLVNLDDLKYIWKSNQWMILEFPNLTSVYIYGCKSLEHVFTCSIAGSLVQLQHLSIGNCEKVEVIVKEDEKEEVEGGDAKVNEILLPHLKSIQLEDLPNLKGFCTRKESFSWPLLDTLEIKECPAITVFTKGHLDTPEELKVIDTSFGMCYVREDLNSFLRTKQKEGYKF